MSEDGESKSGAGVYLLGVLFLAGAIGGIVWITHKDPPKTDATTPHVDAQPPPVVNNAPPPPAPPSLDELPTATASASVDAGSAKASTGSGSGAAGMCSKCTEGVSSSALNSKVQSIAGSAQGCYNRALRTSAASGKITVSVQVGANGSVCNASIANDTVGSGEISSCVLGKFRGASLPPPEQGCVTLNVPINFKIAGE